MERDEGQDRQPAREGGFAPERESTRDRSGTIRDRVVAPAAANDDDGDEDRTARAQRDPGAIRADDTEPYVALQYVARLFKVVAMVVIVALTAEIVMGVVYEGTGALLPLIAEVVKGGVLAAILWGVSDLTLLFIDVGHDVRASRVLLGRLSARAGADPPVRRGFGDDDED
ncbi:MAG: hypothetical protein JWM27_2891 [Gemmatimonadetes bacterium]|nr:hypothetical protein [Gemmatimonadota bacterium]